MKETPREASARFVRDPPTWRGDLLRYIAAAPIVVLSAGLLVRGLAAVRGEVVAENAADDAVYVDLPPALAAPQPPDAAPPVAAAPPPPPKVQESVQPLPPVDRAEPALPPRPPDIPPPIEKPAPMAPTPPSASESPAQALDHEEAAPARVSAHAISLWQRALVARIERVKGRSPHLRGAVGTVQVGFEIDADGRLLEAHVVHTAGTSVLDAAALALVRAAAPFPVPPYGVEKTARSFVVPIRFRR